MSATVDALVLTAASLGLIHTILGPDHYVPFLAMARAGRWSLAKTLLITFLCGLGHVGSSVLLGLLGLWLGTTVAHLESIEAWRGDWAGWALLAFGLVYTAWGLRQAWLKRPHHHYHHHETSTGHVHEHTHQGPHLHVHPDANHASLGPWILFTVFIFGPCEPLIPLVMYPAAQHNWLALWLVAGVFGVVTIGAMLSVVISGLLGLRRVALHSLEQYSHALAGAAILACGIAVKLGL